MITAHHHDSITSPDANRFVADWVSRRIWGEADQFERYATTSVTQNGALIAGIVWHKFMPRAEMIHLSGASISKRWLTPSVLCEIFRYPFDILGLQMVTTGTSERNLEAIKLNEGLGFQMTRIERLRGRDEAEVVGCLTDDAWRAHPIYKRGRKG